MNLNSLSMDWFKICFKKYVSRRIVPCRNPGLNRGPLDLQSNALPTELFRLMITSWWHHNSYFLSPYVFIHWLNVVEHLFKINFNMFLLNQINSIDVKALGKFEFFSKVTRIFPLFYFNIDILKELISEFSCAEFDQIYLIWRVW